MMESSQPQNEYDAQAESNHAWSLEPYAELRTVPAAWDLSELMIPPRPSKNGNSQQPSSCAASSSSEADSSPEDGNQTAWRPEPFPEPKTYPLHWDFSG